MAQSNPTPADPLTETWQIHDRINAYLLDAIPATSLAVAPTTGGRTVGQIFAHIHNVRLMWLEATGAKIPASVVKLDKDAKFTTAMLTKALGASGKEIAALIEASLAGGGRVKGFKPHVHAFVGYLISHESHHRGQLMVALKGNGIKVDKKIAYGIWEWGVR